MKMAVTAGAVRERERERESYTLVNKSGVTLKSQKTKNKIKNIKIEDSFKMSA